MTEKFRSDRRVKIDEIELTVNGSKSRADSGAITLEKPLRLVNTLSTKSQTSHSKEP